VSRRRLANLVSVSRKVQQACSQCHRYQPMGAILYVCACAVAYAAGMLPAPTSTLQIRLKARQLLALLFQRHTLRHVHLIHIVRRPLHTRWWREGDLVERERLRTVV